MTRAAQALAAFSFVLAGLFPVHNADTFGHLAQGRQIAQLGRVPTHDTFSLWHSAPAPWRNYEWLSDLLTYQLYALGGANALLAGKCVLLALCAALLVALADRLAGVRAALMACVLLVLFTAVLRFRFTERPQVFGYVLFAVYAHATVRLIDDDASSAGKRIVGLFAAHVLWVNLHGSHLLGLAIVGAGFVWHLHIPALRNRFALALAALLVACCVSPFGPYIVLDAVEHVLSPAYRDLISEWQPWQPEDSLWLLLMPSAVTLGLVALVVAITRTHPATRGLLSVALLLALATSRSLRFIAEYLLLAAPLLAAGLARVTQALPVRRVAYATAALLLTCAVAVPRVAASLPPFVGVGVGESGLRLPVGAGAWLRTHHPTPRVLASMEDSWYLMFAVPQARVLIDGRAPFYGPEPLRAVQRAFVNPAELRSLIRDHAIDTVVVRYAYAAHRGLLLAMQATPEFVLADIEDRYATFVRRNFAVAPIPLVPSYDPDWLFAATPARQAVIRDALSKLPEDDAHAGYRGFVRALLAMQPLLRGGPRDGLRAPTTPSERDVLHAVSEDLARASRGAEVPLIDAYRALALIGLCDLDAADAALQAAEREGESRETILGRLEWRLRRGETEVVTEQLRAAREDPRARSDAWLAAIEAALSTQPSCGAPR